MLDSSCDIGAIFQLVRLSSLSKFTQLGMVEQPAASSSPSSCSLQTDWLQAGEIGASLLVASFSYRSGPRL